MSAGELDAFRRAIDGYLRQLAREVPRLSGGEGRAVLGPVAGRAEVEDVEIGLDRYSEDLLQRWLEECDVDVELYSEHSRRRIGGRGSAPYLITCDPFDGSGHFMRGLPAEWWSVLTVWRAEEEGPSPVMAGAVDINRRDLYMATDSAVTVESLYGGEARDVRPLGRKGAVRRVDHRRLPDEPEFRQVLDETVGGAADDTGRGKSSRQAVDRRRCLQLPLAGQGPDSRLRHVR